MPFVRGSFSHLRPLPTARPGYPVLPVVRGIHEDYLYLLFKGVGTKRWGYLRANPGVGVFWFIPPSWLNLSSANLLHIEDFLQSIHGVGVTWVSSGNWLWTSFQDVLGFENLARRILVRNRINSPYPCTEGYVGKTVWELASRVTLNFRVL